MLLIEDNSADVILIRRAMHEAGLNGEVSVARDGEEAIRLVNRTDADTSLECPALVVLDLNLPKVHGSDVLRHLRQSPRFGAIPVIVLTSSDAGKDRLMMTELGAQRYLRKPLDLDEFMAIGGLIASELAGSE